MREFGLVVDLCRSAIPLTLLTVTCGCNRALPRECLGSSVYNCSESCKVHLVMLGHKETGFALQAWPAASSTSNAGWGGAHWSMVSKSCSPAEILTMHPHGRHVQVGCCLLLSRAKARRRLEMAQDSDGQVGSTCASQHMLVEGTLPLTEIRGLVKSAVSSQLEGADAIVPWCCRAWPFETLHLPETQGSGSRPWRL